MPSLANGAVPSVAIFTVAKRFAPPYPSLVLLAGSGGHKDTDYVRLASDLMSTLGYATVSIDETIPVVSGFSRTVGRHRIQSPCGDLGGAPAA